MIPWEKQFSSAKPLPLLPGSHALHRQHIRFARIIVTAEKQHLSVCLNKTCKKQGSAQIAKFVEDLGLPDLTVERTGCLGKCGAGPNIVLSPLNVKLSHVQTSNKMTQILQEVGGLNIPQSLLKATSLRLHGNSLAREGNLKEAARVYKEALDLNISQGRYMILSNRAGVLLGMGNYREAANDAAEAVQLSPPEFQNSVFRLAEAYICLGQRQDAAETLQKAVERDPSIKQSSEFKELKQHINSKSGWR